MSKSDSVWNSSNTRIVVDSSSNVPESLRSRYRMIEAPTLVNFGVESFRNNVDLSTEAFYERFAESEQIPTTSQPPPKYFADAYRQAFADGARHIIVVTVSRKLSGTFASSQTAIQSLDDVPYAIQGVDDERFLFWDGESISMGSGWQAIAAARLLEEGFEREALVERLTAIRSATVGYATLDTLKYAALSGRISNLQASIGNLLHVKAILEVDDGNVTPIARARGRKRSLRDIVERLAAQFGSQPIRAAFLHANTPDEAEQIAEAARKRMTIVEEYIGDIGPTIASFGGPGAIGLVGYPSHLG